LRRDPPRDLVLAALGLALAAAYWARAAALPDSLLSDDFGADGLPRALAVLLAVLSTAIGMRALWKTVVVPGKENHPRALGVAGMGVGYALLAPWLGYPLAVMLLAGAGAFYYGARGRVKVALFALGSAALLWFMFAYVLHVAMPVGALF
jgi:putative tricarboxylic transport membrane protein